MGGFANGMAGFFTFNWVNFKVNNLKGAQCNSIPLPIKTGESCASDRMFHLQSILKVTKVPNVIPFHCQFKGGEVVRVAGGGSRDL